MGRSDVDGVGRTRMWRFRRVAGRYVNPVTRRVAGKLPAFGVLTHRGRKTGRTYRTPVNVFRRGDLYVFFLTYGSQRAMGEERHRLGRLLARDARSRDRTRRARADHGSR